VICGQSWDAHARVGHPILWNCFSGVEIFQRIRDSFNVCLLWLLLIEIPTNRWISFS
jgi:hypothetical protein